MELNSIIQQKLERLNKGTNFLNFEKPKRYYIKVMLNVTQDLKRKDEEISVNTNLSFGRYYNYNVEEFLKDLENFVKTPLGKVITTNRKVELRYGELNNIKNKIRTETIKFSDIDIEIGELADKKLREQGIIFEEKVKKLLKQQDESKSDKIQRKVDTYVRLKEQIEVLKNLLGKERDSYYYGNTPQDETIKLTLSPQEYNKKLKEIEVQLRKVEKEFGLDEEQLKYIKIQKEVNFDEWLKVFEDELRESFEEDFEETFEEYAERVYEESDKTIEE